MSEAFKLNQEQNEIVQQIITENTRKLNGIIEMFSKAPKGQLDESYTKECKKFMNCPENPVLFLRNLKDKVVHTSGGSDFVVKAISAALSFFPEEKSEEQALRRANLAQEMGITSTMVKPEKN